MIWTQSNAVIRFVCPFLFHGDYVSDMDYSEVYAADGAAVVICFENDFPEFTISNGLFNLSYHMSSLFRKGSQFCICGRLWCCDTLKKIGLDPDFDTILGVSKHQIDKLGKPFAVFNRIKEMKPDEIAPQLKGIITKSAC